MLRLTLFLLLCFSSLQSFAQSEQHIWPTNASRHLSSTFGETRAAHFHAGLDIKTWGREGYKVYATKSGTLHRILITNKGYGKALYLKHNDGTYTVYAHLQRFNSRIQAIADSARLKDYSYEMDLYVDQDSVYIEQGDVIAYTGSTGIGPPHLHYEIRDVLNEPTNPLFADFPIKDTKPPVFRSLLVEPLNESTLIEGAPYPKSFALDEDETLNVYANGPVGLAVNVYDPADEVYNKYAVYELILTSKTDTLFYQRKDEFSFQQAPLMFLDRVPDFKSDRRNFQRLYKHENIDHPFIIIDKTKETTLAAQDTLTLTAKDFFGNSSSTRILVQEQAVDFNTTTHSQGDYWTFNWKAEHNRIVDFRNFDQGVIWDSQNQQRLIEFPHDLNKSIARLAPSTNSWLSTPDRNLSLHFDTESLFDTTSFTFDYYLKNDTTFIEVGNPQIPLKNGYDLLFYLEGMQADSTLRLYEIDDEEFDYIDSKVQGHSLRAYPNSFGTFVILNDTTAPSIKSIEKVTLGDGQESYSIQTSDNLSGVDFKSAIFKINDAQGIAEYDYEGDYFTFYLPNIVLKKENNVYFEVRDKAGNLSSKSFLLKN